MVTKFLCSVATSTATSSAARTSFPEVGVDDADAGPAADRLAFGLSDAEASRRLDLERGGLAYYVACLRELFEEAGLLIVCDANGEPVQLNDPATTRVWRPVVAT
jgi:8-oxo-dGTP pyrophosphatase MutT (NUDIX family)